MTRQPNHSFTASEYMAALIVLALSVGVGIGVYFLYKAKNFGPAIILGGLDMILLAGCFDPINALWHLVPFTFHPLVKRPYSLEQRILRRAGFFVVVVGVIYVCGGKPWLLKIQHTVRRYLKLP